MDIDLSQFYNQFREETIENVRVLHEGLLTLEKVSLQDPSARIRVNTMFRAVHTIKGSARMLGFSSISLLAHAMEDLLGAVRSGTLDLGRTATDYLLKGGDTILEQLDAAINGQPPASELETLHKSIVDYVAAHNGLAIAPVTATPEPATQAAEAQPTPVTAAAEPTTLPAPEPPIVEQEPEPLFEPAATPVAVAGRTNAGQTVRVRTDRLDRLLNLTGELVISQQVVANHEQMLRELLDLNLTQERLLLDLEQSQRQQLGRPMNTNILDDVNTLLNNCNRLDQLLRQQVEAFTRYANNQHALVDDMEQEVIRTRLMPIGNLFLNLPRAVRDLASQTEKEINLEMRGEETELDRKLIEALKDPLLHLVRNAIDHGIEPPNEREAVGKPYQGRLTVSAEALGSEVRVTIQDDGCGIHPEKIRESAVRKGVISKEQATTLTDREALDLVFVPGFSTAATLTDLSGRGVGMDVVRTNVNELNGQVLLESEPGHGTTIVLMLPLTLVTTRVLLVRIGNYSFALPASGCQGITWIYRDTLKTVEGRAVVGHEGRTVPVLRLADLLELETAIAFAHDERMPAVLLGNEQMLLAVLVDQVIDEREAIVKSLGPLLAAQRHYTGAVQLGDGQLTLMLNPATLSQIARGVTLWVQSDTPQVQQRHHLLVADDSFTTRELMASILRSAGYEVTVALDGIDALEKLRVRSYDLVVSDVEMPRMDGFALTSRIRQELQLPDLPVIIVTSLASNEHRRRGLEAGAQAYIVKSQFNQDNLLGAIEQLLGR